MKLKLFLYFVLLFLLQESEAFTQLPLVCGNEIININEPTEIRYPASGSYRDSEHCSWVLKAPKPNSLEFKVTYIDLEPQSNYPHCYDYISVNGESNCRTLFTVVSPTINLIFHSDGSNTRLGFRAQVKLNCVSKFPPLNNETYILFRNLNSSVFQSSVPEDHQKNHTKSEIEIVKLGQTAGKNEGCSFLSPQSKLESCFIGNNGKCNWTTTEPPPDELYNHLVFKSPSSYLDKICLYLIYQTNVTSSVVNIHVEKGSSSSKLQSLRLFPFQKNNVKIMADVPDALRSETSRVVLEVLYPRFSDLEVFRIQACNPYRDQDRFKIPFTLKHELLSELENTEAARYTSDIRCNRNGWYLPDGNCTCHIGFSGPQCSKACGPNSFGPNCVGQCSSNKDMCKGITFATERGTTCASGFHGDICQDVCKEGEYGPSCSQTCGQCRTSSCDPYTGICPNGCVPGYNEPFCHSKVVHFTGTLEVRDVTMRSAIINANLQSAHLSGVGIPKYYTIHYKQKNELLWSDKDVLPVPVNKNITEKLNDLVPGTTYLVKLTLFDENLLSFSQNTKTTNFTTNCLAPEKLNVSVDVVAETSMILSWQVIGDEELLCKDPTYQVEIISDGDWEKTNTTNNYLLVDNLLHSTNYIIRVKPVHQKISSQYYYTSTTTLDKGRGRILDLVVTEITDSSIALKWNASPQTDSRKFKIKYECILMGARYTQRCESDRGVLETTGNHILVQGLKPHRSYKFIVEPVPGENSYIVKAATKHTVPAIGPVLVNSVINESTIIVNWDNPDDCSLCNGFLYGYQYTIHNESNKAIQSATTKDKSININQLNPDEDYVLKVWLVNSAGINESASLNVKLSTQPSKPSKVKDLTVYKTGRNQIGLRWLLPELINGPLSHFLIEFENKSITVMNEPCTPWPTMFCKTITGLKFNNNYTFTVSAVNSKAKGRPVSISAVTIENVPEAPVNLEVINITETSLEIKWSPPLKFNGVLRSFLIKIEETNHYQSAECCRYYPKVDVFVTEELPEYSSEITGLSAGSTYALSVMAETVWLGPPLRMTVCTRPPRPHYVSLPVVSIGGNQTVTWELEQSSQAHSEQLDRLNYLIVIPLDSDPVEGTTQNLIEDLLTMLEKEIKIANYYIATTYTEGQVIDLKLRDVNDPKTLDSLLSGDSYIMMAVAVETYCGLSNVATLSSDPFVAGGDMLPR